MERIDMETYIKAKELIGSHPNDISSEAATAINCAFDMGYRSPEAIAEMARKLLDNG